MTLNRERIASRPVGYIPPHTVAEGFVVLTGPERDELLAELERVERERDEAWEQRDDELAGLERVERANEQADELLSESATALERAAMELEQVERERDEAVAAVPALVEAMRNISEGRTWHQAAANYAAAALSAFEQAQKEAGE